MLVTCAPDSNNLMGVNTFLSPDAFIEAAMAATYKDYLNKVINELALIPTHF